MISHPNSLAYMGIDAAVLGNAIACQAIWLYSSRLTTLPRGPTNDAIGLRT